MARARPAGQIFDEVPWLYDRSRPGYPDAAIDALVEIARLGRGSKIVEVGAGTGQLTLPLLQRELEVTALEPGERMASLLERKVADAGVARVIRSRLEDANLPSASFDGVVSATAFHWVDPDRRYGLAARLLCADGALALIRNDHVLTARSAPYYRGARASYRRHAPEMGPRHMPPKASSLPGLAGEMEASGLFEDVTERRFRWDRRYTAPELIRLLRTYSAHRAMHPTRRHALFDELQSLVDDQLGGSFVDGYVTSVCVGRMAQNVRRWNDVQR